MLKFEKDNREIGNSLKSSAISRRFVHIIEKNFAIGRRLWNELRKTKSG